MNKLSYLILSYPSHYIGFVVNVIDVCCEKYTVNPLFSRALYFREFRVCLINVNLKGRQSHKYSFNINIDVDDIVVRKMLRASEFHC